MLAKLHLVRRLQQKSLFGDRAIDEQKKTKTTRQAYEPPPIFVEGWRYHRLPHVAFEVDDIEDAIAGFKVIDPITSPSEGVRLAMIVDNGAPIELIEFSAKRRGVAKSKRRERASKG